MFSRIIGYRDLWGIGSALCIHLYSFLLCLRSGQAAKPVVPAPPKAAPLPAPATAPVTAPTKAPAMMSWPRDHAEERRSIISTAWSQTDIYWHLTILNKCEQHTVLNYWWSVNVSASFSRNGALQLWAHPTLNSRCNPVTIDDDRKETGKGWEGKPGKPVWLAFSQFLNDSMIWCLVPTSWSQDLWLKSTHLIHSLPAHQHLKLLAAALHAKQFIDSASHQSFLEFCSTRAKRILAVLQSVLFAYLNNIRYIQI